MWRDWSPLGKTAAVTAGSLLVGLVVGFIAPGLQLPENLPLYVVAIIFIEIVVSTFNVLFMLVLAGVYYQLYRELPNKYTVSLLVLGIALLLYGFTGHPLVHLLFGFVPRVNVGAFTFLPDLFVSAGIIVLFYQSQT
ncbi:MAG: hypothetical protein ABEI31_06985 [Halodesulfurarchaeum sp.]